MERQNNEEKLKNIYCFQMRSETRKEFSYSGNEPERSGKVWGKAQKNGVA